MGENMADEEKKKLIAQIKKLERVNRELKKELKKKKTLIIWR